MTDNKENNESNESSENNVIPFPAKRKKQSSSPRKPTLFWDGDLRATLGGASIIALLIAVSIVNNESLKKDNYTQPGQPGRGIASAELDNRDKEIEKEYVESLKKLGSDADTFVARTPSAEEKLRFGELSGLYAFNYDNGKIKSIKYMESEKQPVYIKDVSQFILKNKNLVWISFSTIQLKKDLRKVATDKKVDVYHLLNDGQVVGLVEIELDKFGRFLGLTVKKN